MKEVSIMIEDLKAEKKREMLAELGLRNPKEGGLDKEPVAIVKVPEEWQIRITKGSKVLMTWSVGEEETDDGEKADLYVDDFSSLEDKVVEAFDNILEAEEEKKDDGVSEDS